MPITNIFVISNAEKEIEKLEKRAKGVGNTINKVKQSIQDNNQTAIAQIAQEYLRIQPNNPLSTCTDIDRANKLIDIYEQDRTDYQEKAEKIKTLVQQLKENDKNLCQELKELNEKLDICSDSGHTIEICGRLESLIKKFILTMENSCQEHLTKCRTLFPEQ